MHEKIHKRLLFFVASHRNVHAFQKLWTIYTRFLFSDDILTAHACNSNGEANITFIYNSLMIKFEYKIRSAIAITTATRVTDTVNGLLIIVITYEHI